MDGDGGPFYVEGVIYTTNQFHMHQVDSNHSAWVRGSIVADYIRLCEWMDLEHRKWPALEGFSYEEGSVRIYVQSWREVTPPQ